MGLLDKKFQSYEQPSLSDYAIIGDGRSCALIARDGSIDWLCLPGFSSPSFFAAILDGEKGGRYTITLDGLQGSERRYLPDSAVLETTMRSERGSIRLTECMPVMPDDSGSLQLAPLREIIRRVEILEGEPTVKVFIDVRPDYGRRQGRFISRDKTGWTIRSGHYSFNLVTNFPLTENEGRLSGQLTTSSDKIFWFSLGFDHRKPGIIMPLGAEAEHRMQSTLLWWTDWCAQIKYEGDYRACVIRSAITLRQLAFTLSGGLIAAATTSLPEKPQGWMNWDYRYCWPRDAALSLSAFIDIGLYDEADAFLGWLILAANVSKPHLHVMYDVFGRYRIKEHILDHLSGYRGARPVRIGNKLSHQIQHDVYGEVLMAIEDWVCHSGTLKPQEISLIREFGARISAKWREPDNGIWEIRDQKRHYTYSKVMAWYVLDGLLRLHNKFDLGIPVEEFSREREAIRKAIEESGYNSRLGCYTGVFSGDTVDASLLLLPRCGYIAYDHPRMRGTWERITETLEVNGLIRRYPEGFANSQPGEAAFIICNFWAIDYLLGCGAIEQGEARLKHLLTFANDVGLYTEGVLPETGESCGNLPQAFSHAGLINTLLNLELAKKRSASDRRIA